MKLLGITGGVGMGKSACADLLAGMGASVIDTDQIARDVVKPGTEALKEVVTAFGPGMLDSKGELRRGELARRVFASSQDRSLLEDILHPRIREVWKRTVRDWQAEGRRLGAVIIPLLFETESDKEFDSTICVACSEQTQMERLLPRGWTPGQISQRINAQLPVATKMARATYVIWSEGSLAVHEAQLRRILSNWNPLHR